MKYRVTFEIKGTQLADGYALNTSDLQQAIMMAFDNEGGSPLFDDRLDTRRPRFKLIALLSL